jgi:multisubunit Na+/H+ antiporter MnhB subunit
MEAAVSILIGLMIIAAIVAILAKDLLSSVIVCGIVGYSLVICFLLLRAPDLAIVQIVVETVTLIIMVAVVLNSSREEKYYSPDKREWVAMISALFFLGVLLWFFREAAQSADPFGEGSLRMARYYTEGAMEKTGSANLVTGVIFDFRGYDTLGEAVVLVTAVLGVLTILRLKGKKSSP